MSTPASVSSSVPVIREFFREFPENIKSPDYGDKWGRLANYIEINNRAIAEMHGDKTSNGILSTIKILPAIIYLHSSIL